MEKVALTDEGLLLGDAVAIDNDKWQTILCDGLVSLLDGHIGELYEYINDELAEPCILTDDETEVLDWDADSNDYADRSEWAGCEKRLALDMALAVKDCDILKGSMLLPGGSYVAMKRECGTEVTLHEGIVKKIMELTGIDEMLETLCDYDGVTTEDMDGYWYDGWITDKFTTVIMHKSDDDNMGPVMMAMFREDRIVYVSEGEDKDEWPSDWERRCIEAKKMCEEKEKETEKENEQ